MRRDSLAIEIGLDPAVSKAPADQPALRDLMAKGALSALIFDTDDCDAAFEQIRSSGAEVLQEPIDQPYGVRDCAFRDPSGNMVRFSQRARGLPLGAIANRGPLLRCQTRLATARRVSTAARWRR